MKNIGSVVGLYPTPVTIIGTEVNGKINWINIAHIGIVGVKQMMLSIHKSHYSNQGIFANKTVSVNLVSEEILIHADYAGIVSGKKTDKSKLFDVFYGDLEHAPLIKNAPLAMACAVDDVYRTETHDNFIIHPVSTYVPEENLTADGRIDYEKVKPLLFEMPGKQYLSLGKVIDKCWSVGKSCLPEDKN